MVGFCNGIASIATLTTMLIPKKFYDILSSKPSLS